MRCSGSSVGTAGGRDRTAGTLADARRWRTASPSIALTNPALSAVVEVFEDAVADPAGNGTALGGPFAGVPYLMKDQGPTLQGRLQELRSQRMQGHRPAQDSLLTSQIRNSGLNIMGRATTPKFGVCSSAETRCMSRANPWDLDHTTSGSSAGTAALVAAGVLALSHATDGGGSIRIPPVSSA